MKHALVSLLSALLLVAGWVHPVDARDLPAGGMTSAEVAAWLRNASYPATVKPDPTTPGDEIISSSVDGINFDIYMYQCTSGRCKSLQYVAGWPASPNIATDRTNAWNRGHRFCRAYLTTGGSVYCEFDIDIDPGGTYEALDHSLVRWRAVVGDFKQTVIG